MPWEDTQPHARDESMCKKKEPAAPFAGLEHVITVTWGEKKSSFAGLEHVITVTWGEKKARSKG